MVIEDLVAGKTSDNVVQLPGKKRKNTAATTVRQNYYSEYLMISASSSSFYYITNKIHGVKYTATTCLALAIIIDDDNDEIH